MFYILYTLLGIQFLLLGALFTLWGVGIWECLSYPKGKSHPYKGLPGWMNG